MKKLNDIETDQIQLEVYECDCGFHIGLDYSYMEQVKEIKIKCPSCGKEINTEDIK